MKKTLLLSVVASTMIMAGGDIAPVEPVIETPVVEASGWDFSGQAVLYYQTRDLTAARDLFDPESSAANSGIQLRAVNSDIAYGIGAGVEVSGLGTLGLQDESIDLVDNTMQGTGGWISQAYLTYGFGNTAVKLGRQELPKSLSPFAFSENWNVFKNTFDAALVVNTDISDTTLVGAWVAKANSSVNVKKFNGVNNAGIPSNSNAKNGTDQGIFMATVQNKSIEGLTLTGTWYYASEWPDVYSRSGKNISTEDANILWVDAKFNVSNFNVALQGGTIMSDALADDSVAFGGKVGADYGMFSASVAYSSTDENANAIDGFKNVGGVKTPLYTQMILNQGVIRSDADYVKVAASANLYGGTFGVAYGYAIANEDDLTGGKDNNPYELDVTYKTKVFNDSTTVFAGYVLENRDVQPNEDSNNMLRFWARYNF